MPEVADLFVRLRAETAPFTRGMRQAAEGGEGLIARMGGLRAAMVKVGGATAMVGVGFVAYGVKAAGDFQQQMNLLVTACGESTDNLKQVSNGVLSLARQTGTSTGMLADGMYQVEKAGYRGADGLKVLKAAAQGAREEGASLKDVTNAMTSVMASYHLKASDSVRVMNALKTAAGEGKITMEEFSGALSTVLPIASANKISFGEVGGAIATLTQHGTSAREATQELASTIRSLAAPNGVAVQEMQRLGLSSIDVSTKLGQRGLTGTLDLLTHTVLSKMGPSGTLLMSSFNRTKQAAQDADAMVRAMPASLQKLALSYGKGSISLGDWRRELKTLPPEQANLLSQYATLHNKTNGFSAELKKGGPAAQTYTDAIKKMSGGAIGLNTTLQLTGESSKGFKDRVGKVSDSFHHASKNVEGWKTTQKSFNVQMGRLKETVTTAAITIGLKLIPVILAVVSFFEKHRSVAIALGIVIGTILVAAVVAFTISLWNMAAAALANPLVWIVLAVIVLIAAIVLLVIHWRQVWDFIKRITMVVVDWIVDKWNWLTGQAASIWSSISGAVVDAWNSLVGYASTAWHAVVDPIVAGWHWFERTTSAVWDGITGFFKKWWPLLLVIFLPAVAVVMAIWNHFHAAIMSTVHAVWNAVLGALKAVWNGIKASAKFVWGLIRVSIVDPIMATWKTIVSVWEAVHRWLSTMWAAIKRVASDQWARIKSSMIDPIIGAWHKITSTIGDIKKSISDGLDSAWNKVKSIGSRFESIGKSIVMGIVHGVQNAAGSLFDSLKGLADSALKSARGALHINSPSKLFADHVGSAIPEGIAKGVDDNAHLAHRSVRSLAAGLSTARVATPGLVGTAAMAGRGSHGGVVNHFVTVHVAGHVMTERQLVDAVQEGMLRRGMRNPQTYPVYGR